MDYARIVLKYVVCGVESDDETLFLKLSQQYLSSTLQGDAMTFAQRFEQNGLEKGLKQGIQQGIQQGVQQGIQQGIQQGVRQGVQQGVRQGVQQGREERSIEVAKRLLSQNRPVDLVFIASISGLSITRVKQLALQVNSVQV